MSEKNKKRHNVKQTVIKTDTSFGFAHEEIDSKK